MITKILIGVDDSKYAEEAAKYGFDLAKKLDAHVGLVNIIEPLAVSEPNVGTTEIFGTPLQSLGSINNIEISNAQNEVSENIIQRIAKEFGSGLDVTQFNDYGSTGEGIISCSAEFKADLIVVGTHHRSGFDRLFSSNVAEYLVHHSKIPVSVVPAKD